MGIAAAAVASVAVVIARSGDFGASGHTPHNHRPALGPAVPTGMQAVAYHGVQLFVPASWRINDVRCGTPQGDTVILGDRGLETTCLTASPPNLTVVTMRRIDTPLGRQAAAVAHRAVRVRGVTAREGTGELPQRDTQGTVLVIPSVDVVVSVSAPRPASVAAILDTARVVKVDSNGCVQRLGALVPQPGRDVEAQRLQLVPGLPVSASLCRYSDDWLAQSVALTVGQMQRLQRILNALPAGATRLTGFRHEPRQCATDARHGFMVHFRFRNNDLQVAVHVGDCSMLTAYNGVRLTEVSGPLISMLVGLASYDGELPPPGEVS
jgi:hypothetical protein